MVADDLPQGAQLMGVAQGVQNLNRSSDSNLPSSDRVVGSSAILAGFIVSGARTTCFRAACESMPEFGWLRAELFRVYHILKRRLAQHALSPNKTSWCARGLPLVFVVEREAM